MCLWTEPYMKLMDVPYLSDQISLSHTAHKHTLLLLNFYWSLSLIIVYLPPLPWRGNHLSQQFIHSEWAWTKCKRKQTETRWKYRLGSNNILKLLLVHIKTDMLDWKEKGKSVNINPNSAFPVYFWHTSGVDSLSAITAHMKRYPALIPNNKNDSL